MSTEQREIQSADSAPVGGRSSRVGVLTTWNQPCGLATYAKSFVSELDTRNIVIFAQQTTALTSEDEPFVVRCWSRVAAGAAAPSYGDLERAIDEARIDVLHINCRPDFFAQPSFGALLKRLQARSVKVVVQSHCIYSLSTEAQALFKSADAVIVHSAESRLEAIANGAEPSQVVVIPHGVTIRMGRTDESKSALRARLGLGLRDDQPLIVGCGFIQPHKGFESVLYAVQHLRSKGVEAHGLIIGQPHVSSARGEEYLERLKTLVGELGISQWTKFLTGYVSDELLSDFLAAADLVLLDYKSQYIESSGVAALALGTGSIVATSIAPSMLQLGDAVWHITSGYTAQMSAEILLTNPTLRKEIEKRAAEYCREHSWPKTAEKFVDLYRSIGLSLATSAQAKVVNEEKESPVTTNTTTSATKPLRILMQNRSGTFSARGGDTVVLERLRDGLIARGCQVTVDVTGKEDARNFDLVHLFNFATPDLTRALAEAATKAGTPFVVTSLYEEVAEFHNQSQAVASRVIEYVSRNQDRDFWSKYKLNLSLIPRAQRFDNEWVANNAAAIFANGESEKRAIERDFPRAKNAMVIRLGHEVGPKAGPEAFEREYGVRDFVLCVGRLETRKNQLMLLKALENSELTVVLAAGGFSYQPDYAEAVRKFKRKGQTLVLDRLSPEMLASAYAACRVHVLPSWFELPGLVSLEAAAYGKNVVATKTGTTADYLGDTAFYCTPWDEDSIEAAVTAAYYAPPKSGVVQMASSFSWERTIDETLAAYRSVLGIAATATTAVATTAASATAACSVTQVNTPAPSVSASTSSTVGHYDLSSASTEMQDALERGELAAKSGQFETALKLLTTAESLNPQSARVLKALGAVHLALSDSQKALGYFERALKLAPTDTKVLAGRGMCEVLSGRFAEAAPYFERALQSDPIHLVAIHQLLRCAYETGAMESAERHLTTYMGQKPEDSAMRFCLAGCLYRQRKYVQAHNEIKRVVKEQPHDNAAIELQKLIEQALADAGVEAQQAVMAASNAAASTAATQALPDTTSAAAPVAAKPILTAPLSEINDSLSELSKRISEWKVGAAAESPTKTYIAPAAAAAASPEPTRSVAAPTRKPTEVVPVQPGSVGQSPAEGYIESKLCAVEDLRRDRKTQEARAAFEAIKSAVGMSSQQQRRVRCLEAEFLVLDGDLTGADKVYNEVLAQDPNNARALCGKGALAAESQAWDEARGCFERALQALPGYDVAIAGLGLCEMVGNNGETAFELFRKAATLNPENQRALLGVMQVGYPLKKFREIEELLARYLDIHPASMDMLYSFAGVLFAQGKMQQARMEVEKILLFEPTNTRALELRKMIDTEGSKAGSVMPN